MCSSQQFAFNTTPSIIRCPSRKHPSCILFKLMTYLRPFITVKHYHMQMAPNFTNLLFELMNSLKLQNDFNFFSDWSSDNLSINAKKFVHLSFNTNISSFYNVDDSMIMSNSSHQDLDIICILFTDLCWKNHYDHISSKAYKTLGLLTKGVHLANPSMLQLRELYACL